MQNEAYIENIKEALKNLVRVNESIYYSVISICMQGELKEWNDQVPVGEVHQFDFEIFKNSEDVNIKMLVKILDDVDTAFASIANINAIDGEVLQEGMRIN